MVAASYGTVVQVQGWMDLPLQWQQQGGLLYDCKDGKSIFCLFTNDFSDGDWLCTLDINNNNDRPQSLQ